MRLRTILRTLSARVQNNKILTYADFGCSNGFITSEIARGLGIKGAVGFDYSDNVDVGKQIHPEICFRRFNLNVVDQNIDKYELVTCFETLEHVGNLQAAIENICARRARSGILMITVPIEVGWIGVLKYALKRVVFRYDLPLNCTDREYLGALLRGGSDQQVSTNC